MKTIIISLLTILSFQSFAKDMSRTETYEEAYRELEDGSNEYVGGCSLHQDYEGKKFLISETLVDYFVPNDLALRALKAKLAVVDQKLIEAVGGLKYLASADDVTLEKISHKKLKNLDLYRFNIGVGGGNGYYEVFEKVNSRGVVKFVKLANIFDGDIEFCDSKVWNK